MINQIFTPDLQQNSTPRVYILHDNSEWLIPIIKVLDKNRIPYAEYLFGTEVFDIGNPPPPGIYWSRLSASAFLRNNQHAKEYAAAIFAWLNSYNRRVINGKTALDMEVSKVVQYSKLRAAGFTVPKTIVVFDKNKLKTVAREFDLPFVLKYNQGGKGFGVKKFDNYQDFDNYLATDELNTAVDGIILLQEFISSATSTITRLEFVASKFHYAVKVDISDGSFLLCPADSCNLTNNSDKSLPSEKFSLRSDITASDSFIKKLANFLREEQIEIAGIEFFDTPDGRKIVYDINTNTNYNPVVETQANLSAMQVLADFLQHELQAVR